MDETLDGQVALHYEHDVTADEARALANVLKESSSGSSALNVLARLLNGFPNRKADAWVMAESGQLKRLQFHFTDAGAADKKATLQFTFSDYGKAVTVDTPAEQLTVRPEIFTQLFGEGQVQSVK